MKRIGYYVFNIFYYLFYLFPINKNKLLLIMTHDESIEGNVLCSAMYFKSKNPEIFFKKITKETYNFKLNRSLIYKLINFFIITPYHIATSENIFLDNIFLPFAYTKFKKKVNVVQLWHGTGSIKKFALDNEVGLIKKIAKKACSRYSHLIVGSKDMVPIYKSAFNMEDEKIFPIGSPRTDLLFNPKYIENITSKFYNSYKELLNKKIILYAPTFRDDDFKNNILKNKNLNLDSSLNLNLDIFNILKDLEEEYVLMLRLHPAISNNFSIDNLELKDEIKKRIYDFSNFNSLNSLMIVSDCLITDYSSIIFEYSLLNKKMFFYPYDLEDFEKYSRGFYFNYKEFVPGDISRIRDDDIFSEKLNIDKNNSKIKEFKNKYMNTCDGSSCERLYSLIINDQIK